MYSFAGLGERESASVRSIGRSWRRQLWSETAGTFMQHWDRNVSSTLHLELLRSSTTSVIVSETVTLKDPGQDAGWAESVTPASSTADSERDPIWFSIILFISPTHLCQLSSVNRHFEHWVPAAVNLVARLCSATKSKPVVKRCRSRNRKQFYEQKIFLQLGSYVCGEHISIKNVVPLIFTLI